MAAEVIPAPQSEVSEHILDSQQTTCCIVGGGPGGMMLALRGKLVNRQIGGIDIGLFHKFQFT